mmetsp:Transcript_12191/g.18710  ORF Transcript_12191/g.18710 Transcript_12191/m.18710 type:complete len:275 (+) Transcript_12191:347-1171(+)
MGLLGEAMVYYVTLTTAIAKIAPVQLVVLLGFVSSYNMLVHHRHNNDPTLVQRCSLIFVHIISLPLHFPDEHAIQHYALRAIAPNEYVTEIEAMLPVHVFCNPARRQWKSHGRWAPLHVVVPPCRHILLLQERVEQIGNERADIYLQFYPRRNRQCSVLHLHNIGIGCFSSAQHVPPPKLNRAILACEHNRNLVDNFQVESPSCISQSLLHQFSVPNASRYDPQRLRRMMYCMDYLPRRAHWIVTNTQIIIELVGKGASYFTTLYPDISNTPYN